MAKLVLLESAQRELEEIAQVHYNLSGPSSARTVSERIYAALSRLEQFPSSGVIPKDSELRITGYRYVVAGKYICVYRTIADTVLVYHIAHGSVDYPVLFKKLLQKEEL